MMSRAHHQLPFEFFSMKVYILYIFCYLRYFGTRILSGWSRRGHVHVDPCSWVQEVMSQGGSFYMLASVLSIDWLLNSPKEAMKISFWFWNNQCGCFWKFWLFLSRLLQTAVKPSCCFVNTCTDLLVWPWAVLRVKGSKVSDLLCLFFFASYTESSVLWFAPCVFCLCFHWELVGSEGALRCVCTFPPKSLIQTFSFLFRAWIFLHIRWSESALDYHHTITHLGCQQKQRWMQSGYWVSSVKEMNVKQ